MTAGETRATNAVEVMQARGKETERQELGFLEEKWIAVARRAAKGVSEAWRDNGGGSDYTMLGGDFLELIQTRQVATDTQKGRQGSTQPTVRSEQRSYMSCYMRRGRSSSRSWCRMQ